MTTRQEFASEYNKMPLRFLTEEKARAYSESAGTMEDYDKYGVPKDSAEYDQAPCELLLLGPGIKLPDEYRYCLAGDLRRI